MGHQTRVPQFPTERSYDVLNISGLPKRTLGVPKRQVLNYMQLQGKRHLERDRGWGALVSNHFLHSQCYFLSFGDKMRVYLQIVSPVLTR